jgi:hypothetical protein
VHRKKVEYLFAEKYYECGTRLVFVRQYFTIQGSIFFHTGPRYNDLMYCCLTAAAGSIQWSLGLRFYRLIIFQLMIHLPQCPIVSVSNKFVVNDMFMISQAPVSAIRSAHRWTFD